VTKVCIDLDHAAIGLIRTSLEYTKDKFRNYDGYPSYEFKQERMKEVDDAREWLNSILNAANVEATRRHDAKVRARLKRRLRTATTVTLDQVAFKRDQASIERLAEAGVFTVERIKQRPALYEIRPAA
jgi:hypothetical protein